ncbi:hypothetical protein WJX75_005482 [Coccomyxa subellipsoidea]|uniref:PIN domain-like protein n=1 Tax=Coccomyxa subellipsoidea TaxID=248742 RepID=A0ABR2YFI0_9CHLO
MGVQGLWVLLEPVGRRVNIEALTNKRLAVDASIWIYQFMQTMRDAQGEMLRNAHLVGFLRRICRLLFHRVRPIFVFDGATPPLKRRTTIARRRRREQQTAKVRKTAEKLLLAQLKKYALQMDLQGPAAEEAAPAESQQLPTGAGLIEEEAGPSQLPDTSAGDALLAQQLAAELDKGSYAQDMASHLEAGDAQAVGRLALQAVEAMTSNLPTIKEDENEEEEEDDDDEAGVDEEVVLPEGMELDPVVMSTLPPSMQLDLLTKMRENKIYENREKFARHANQPASFSSLQMQEYLKASAFRRKIEGVKDALNASAAAGGAVARRIAAEEGREYILQKDKVKEEPPSGTAIPAGGAAGKVNKAVVSNGLEISLDLPGAAGLDISDLLFSSPPQPKQEASSEEEWENADTGEPASAEKEAGPVSGNQRPADWRERKAQRQKYWSLSQGFRFGRKLADWGGLDDDGDGENDGDGRNIGAAAAAAADAGTEDAQMQEAIRRSLLDATGAGKDVKPADDSDNEGELVWEQAKASGAAGLSRTAAQGDSASAAALKKALLAAEDEIVISDNEDEDRAAPGSAQPQTDGRQQCFTPQPNLNLGKAGNGGGLTADAAKPAAVTQRADQAAASAPKAASAEAGAAGPGPGMFGAHRPVLQDDPEDKMPLIPVLLGRQATPAVPVKKEESGVPEPGAAAQEDERLREDLGEATSPESPVQFSRDPWAHDPWGQEDLWEDPEKGRPWNGPAALEVAAAPAQPQPLPIELEAPEPEMPEFNLEEELAELEKETKTLRASNKRTAGTNEAPTTDMYGDCQELLQLFGLPYIIAPSEAEAQCAWLDANGLVDGVVTDDNDVFLFGAKHVYRHIFENRKYVEEYRTEDVERELGLDQDGLIRLALLLGSDYTEGVGGIGIVNAIETVKAFDSEDGMRKFRDWVMNPDEAELLAAVRPQKKRKRKKQAKPGEQADQEEEQEADAPDPYAGDDPEIAEYKRKHRNMRKNWELPASFPDQRVIEAYRKASVDDSKERFTHGRPDAQLLRTFCKEKFNWNSDKVDEILEPVLKAYDARQAQLTMDSFLSFNERFAKIKSKRLAKAVRGISKASNPHMLMADIADEPGPKRKRGHKQAPPAQAELQQAGVFGEKSESDEELLAAIEAIDPSAPQPARSRGRGGRGSRGGRGTGGRQGRGGTRGRGRSRGRKPKDSDAEEAIELADSTESEDAAEAAPQMGKTGNGIGNKDTNTASQEDEDMDWEPAN